MEQVALLEGGCYRCTKCGEAKPPEDFLRTTQNQRGRTPWCRACTNEYHRVRFKQKRSEGWRRIRTYEHHRKKGLKRKYGITVDEYNALFTAQGGVCCICGTAEAGNPYGVLCVEHEHETGRVRGLVCQPCNFAIGWYESWLNHPLREKIARHVAGEE